MEFEQIYQAYFGPVYRYLCSLTGSPQLAEDLAADTFLKALSALPGYRGECSVYAWLCQIAKNRYVSHLRKQGRMQPVADVPDLAAPQNLQQQAENADTAMRLHRLLHRLPEPQREIFYLRVFGELSFAQIGALFGKSDNWACVTFHRAKKKLQSEMEE